MDTETRTIVIEVSGEPCTFREPRFPDFYNRTVIAMLRDEFPDQGPLHKEIAMLGVCYVPDADEPIDEDDVWATRAFAEIARESLSAFLRPLIKFIEAFGDFFKQACGEG